MQIIFGDIAYPKAEALIIPANSQGLMTRGVSKYLLTYTLSAVKKTAIEEAQNRELDPGDFFTTSPGRLNRRGLKIIYHAVIKKYPSDIPTITDIEKSLNNCLTDLIINDYKSVSIYPLGMEDGDIAYPMIAPVLHNVLKLYDNRIDIKIISDHEKFVQEIKKRIE